MSKTDKWPMRKKHWSDHSEDKIRNFDCGCAYTVRRKACEHNNFKTKLILAEWDYVHGSTKKTDEDQFHSWELVVLFVAVTECLNSII
jgi:hypothetical protein